MDIVPNQDLAEAINREYQSAQAEAKSAVAHAIECGKLLIEAKSRCAHGEWLPWLEANVEFSNKTACDWMKLANLKHASNLENATSIREALRLLDAGKEPSPPAVKRVKATDANASVETPTTIVGKDGKKRKSKASVSKKPELDAQIKKGLDEGKSTQEIRKELGVTNATVERRVQNMTIAELEQENEKLQQATIPAAQLEEFLDLPAKKKLEKAIKVFEAAKLAEMREEFTKELAAKRAELKAQQEKLAEDQYAVTQLRKQLSDARETVDRMMTYDEFKLIRGCLHPDRHPEDVREKFGRAFDIFARLEKCIDPHQPIKLLRERGWPHLSPFARGKTA